MNFFGFGATPEIEIFLTGEEKRKTAEIKTEEGERVRHLLYYDGESVSGQVKVTLRRSNSKFEHQGIRVELIGQIDLFYDRNNPHTFLSLYKDLARPGELMQQQTFNFEFLNVSKPYESYTGVNCKLRYFVRVSVMKRLTDIIKDREIIVHNVSTYPDVNNSIKMEVGIEDCLHIEFEYNRSKYHLQDVIVGKIYFMLVRIKIKHMELAIIKRETTGSGPNFFNENETICKYEIMDGAPVRGESIPMRVFLSGYELTPTFKDISRKFSVRYYLNLVLVDEEDRRYFKQQEIILWRKLDKSRKTFQAALQQQYREMQNPNAQVPVTKNGTESPGPSSSHPKIAIQPASSNSSGLDGRSESGTEAIAYHDGQVKNTSPAKDTEEGEDAIAQTMATMSIGSGKEAYDVTDGVGKSSRKKSSSRKNSLASKAKEADQPVRSPFSPEVTGVKKTLSAGDSDDDDMPALTGSTTMADVHIHSISQEAALEAADASVEVDLNEEMEGVNGKGDNIEGKEE